MVVTGDRGVVHAAEVFPDRGGTVCYLVAVGRELLLGDHPVGNVCVTVRGQDMEDHPEAENSAVKGVVLVMDEIDELFNGTRLFGVREDVVEDCHCLSCLASAEGGRGAVVDEVESRGGAEFSGDGFSEGLLYLHAHCFIHSGGFVADVYADDGVGELERGYVVIIARGRAPVAETYVYESVFVAAGRYVVYVAEHICRALAHYRLVAGVDPREIRNVEEDDVPRGSVAPLIAPAGCRDYARELAGELHRLADVAEPLAPVALRGERHRHLLRRESRVSGPAVLFAVRAVGREVEEVRAVGDYCRVPQLVRHLVRAAEGRAGLK